MEDRDLIHVKQYHRNLINISNQERLLREASLARTSHKAYFLLKIGGFIFSLGKRARSASQTELKHQAELDQKLAR